MGENASRNAELAAAQAVADSINAMEGSDYIAEAVPDDPPDAVLRSASGRWSTRAVEVVSVKYSPSDDSEALLREDRDDLRHIKQRLASRSAT